MSTEQGERPSLVNLERMTIFQEGIREGERRHMAEIQALKNELEKTRAALAYAEKLLAYEEKR